MLLSEGDDMTAPPFSGSERLVPYLWQEERERAAVPDPVNAVQRQVEQDYVNTLAQCPRMREEASLQLLIGNLGRRLDQAPSLHKRVTARTDLIELVRFCTGLPRGLKLLVDELEFIDPAAPEVPLLLCLSDEWEAAGTFADDDHKDLWSELKEVLQSIERASGQGVRGEWSVLRRLVTTATGRRISELPEHCVSLWNVFTYLAGANSARDALPPCMVLIDLLARENTDAARGRVLRRWNRHWAERLNVIELLDTAARHTIEHPQLSTVHLVILIEPDPLGSGQMLVKHWRQWDQGDWRPQRGADSIVPEAALQAVVDRLVVDMEKKLGGRADAGRTGELWLEFVLPVELLNRPVQLWLKSGILGGSVPLALDHPVMVRSLERLRLPELHVAWHRRWGNIGKGRLYWTQPSGGDYFGRLAAEFSRDQRIVALLLSHPPVPDNMFAHWELSAALRAGIPAIVWHGLDCSSTEFRNAVAEIVADGAIPELPQRVAALRRDALSEGHQGSHVAILWDDPTRLPEMPRGIG